MSNNEQALRLSHYRDEINATIRELAELSQRLASPVTTPASFVALSVNNICLMLTGLTNSLAHGSDSIEFQRDEDWLSALAAVHRTFYSSIALSAEAACVEQCRVKKIDPVTDRHRTVNEVCDMLEKLKPDVGEAKIATVQQRLKRTIAANPNLRDYVNFLTKGSGLPKRRQKYWSKYFIALQTVRNKAVHLSALLSPDEEKDMAAGGLGFLIKDHELQSKTRAYKKICEDILLFIEEMG